MVGQTQHDDFGESENLGTDELGLGTATTGTGTSAVSSIFGGGAFSDTSRKKYIIIGGGAAAVLLILGLAYFFTGGGDKMPVAPPTGEEMMAAGEEDEEEALAEEEEALAAEEEVLAGEEMAMPMASETGDIRIVIPSDGRTRNYDETTGGSFFQWEGDADYIVFARDSSLSFPSYRIRISGSNSYTLRDAWPGTWFWRLESADSSSYSDIQSFTIASPQRRNISLSEPTAGASISGESLVSWTGDTKISWYRVEISAGNFSIPGYVFATAGTSVQISGVMSGYYKLRVGGFSEVSGRWEYTDPISVTVQ